LLRHRRVGQVAEDPVDAVVAVALLQVDVRALVLVVVAGRCVAERVAVGEEALGDREPDAGVRAGDESDLGHCSVVPRRLCANR
jgi:hypothetical protein